MSPNFKFQITNCQCLITAFALCALPCLVLAEGKSTAPSNGFEAIGIESPGAIISRTVTDKPFFADRFAGKVVNVTEDEPIAESVDASSLETKESISKNEMSVDDRNKVLGRVDRSAPESFQNLIYNFRKGDIDGARSGARQYVEYLTNLMFEVRAVTRLIGEAFIEQKMIEEDEWVGVEQYIDWTFASARAEQGSPFKLTHEAAMKRIDPASDSVVEVYYFFTLNSRWSREMAAEIERLWLSVKNDKRVKLSAFVLGSNSQHWINSYRSYTGLTVPIQKGDELAKRFSIGLVPAIVVVAPSINKAYVKTGRQDFVRLYEFVRTAQGLPKEITPELQRLATSPIGEVGSSQLASNKVKVNTSAGSLTHVNSVVITGSSMERF